MTPLEAAELLDQISASAGAPSSIAEACKIAKFPVTDLVELLKQEAFAPIPHLMVTFKPQMFAFAKAMFALGVMAGRRKKLN